ncbi:MAG TPA: porin [Chitinophagaceae bacterium]
MQVLAIKNRNDLHKTLLPASLLAAAFLLLPFVSICQQEKKIVPDGTEGLSLEKRSQDSISKKLPPNEFNGPYSTFRIGAGYILDASTFVQDDVFKKQMDSANLKIDPTVQTRDFRILGSGVLTTVKRTIAWKFAYMYDGNEKVWMMRESGITIGVPEMKGHIFVGRTKEGFSMIKVMNGHSPWGYERQMALDVIPILADGIKWFGMLPKSKIFWNLGYFNDFMSKGQGFSTFSWQYVARIGWLPVNNPEKKETLHIATSLRYAKPLDGKMTLKSRPESNNTPQLINTGSFATDHSSHIGGEIFYTNKRFTIGSEIITHNFYNDNGDDHKFSGGNIMISYSITGATRPYKTVGSIFGFVPVKKSVFKGGAGEIEAVVFVSTLNLNSGNIKGGQMWRVTPMINWYMTRVIRFELIYGYGVLDRYGMKGKVQFFESRIQFTIM